MQRDDQTELSLETIRWRPQLAQRQIGVAIMLVVGILAAFMMLWTYPEQDARPHSSLTVDLPDTVAVDRLLPSAIVPMERGSAQQVNAAIPLTTGAVPAAAAFWGPGGVDLTRSADCLTAAIYHEAANESDDGQRAVAQVVLNRARHPAFPHSICGVVFQGAERRLGCQFTFACDGALARTPSAAGWTRARRIAIAALSGAVYAPVGWSTHYHANYVVPRWANELDKVAVVGAHIFYRWRSRWGKPAAFNARYAGSEDQSAMQKAILAARATPAMPEEEVPANAMTAAAPHPVVDQAPIRSLEARPTAAPDASPRRWAIRPDGDSAHATPAPHPADNISH
jgi:hypothetical protein